MSRSRRRETEYLFERFVGNLLRGGVILATAFVLVGGAMYLMRHGTEAPNYHLFRGEPAEFRSPLGVATSVFSGRDRGLIQLELLVFIATLVVRVAFSLLAFGQHRDFTYVTITVIVLTGLLYSLVYGHN